MSTKNVSVDTDINNYSLSELMAIIEIQELDPNEIVKKTNIHINKFKKTNPQLSAFFLEVQSQLLRYAQGLIVEKEEQDNSDKIVVENYENMGQSDENASYPSGDQQVNNWYKNEYLTQNDPNQTSKITNRQQKIKTFGNQYVPMNREQIATTDTFQLPVKQDSLNPNLKNTISRFVNLDSQFRQYTSGIDSTSTDYTLDLSDTLKDALSIRLFSYQIPMSWYTIDKAYGNTCMWVLYKSYIVAVSVPPGNYNQTDFTSELNTSFSNSGFTLNSGNITRYNSNSGILSLFLYGASFTGYTIYDEQVSFTVDETTILLFYDFSGDLHCNNNCLSKSNNFFNNSLGWIMGFRLPYINVVANGNSGAAILDLNGTKYLILVIDDYNQNHVNNNVVSISQFSNTLKTPSYFSNDLPYTCSIPSNQGNNLQELINGVTIDSLVNFQTSNPLNGLLIGGKYEQDYTKTLNVLPSAPRTLTQSQIYTINEINKNRNNNTNHLAKAPTSADILAILPVKTSVGVSTGSLLVEFSGSLQDNNRIYFGPVDIDRMAVKLLDDKGNVLNLNGNDWCVTLVCDCLYQY